MSEPNGVMLQYFHWYSPADGMLWQELQAEASELAAKGFTSLWLPPASKGKSGGYDNGYGIYDMFDLGEFDQKGSIRTKYGTKDEYLAAIEAAHAAGLRVYADIVLNHRMGGDVKETVRATPYSLSDRYQQVGEPREIEAWTHFTFPGRGDCYSGLQWHWWHFDAVDHDSKNVDFEAVYILDGKHFDTDVDLEGANYDYLMGCDLDFSQPEVRGEILYWGKWYCDLTGIDGFRFDAVKHISAEFFPVWVEQMREHTQKNLFVVGEYWSYDIRALHHFIHRTQGKLSVFDAPLHYNFHLASKAGNTYDLRTIFDNTLVQEQPYLAVTLVDNHDSQPLQALESIVEAWFKPLAYALILLRKEGYPCVFIADYHGVHYCDYGQDGQKYDIWLASHKDIIDCFLDVRRQYVYGQQDNYFDHPNTIGWVLRGDDDHPEGVVVLMTNSGDSFKDMATGKANTTYSDRTGHISDTVTTNGDGWGTFICAAGSVSVWVPVA